MNFFPTATDYIRCSRSCARWHWHAEVRDTHLTLRNGAEDPKIESHHPGEGLGNGQIQGTT